MPMISCNEKAADQTNITFWKWQLEAVITEDEIIKPGNKEYFREDAFILYFENDSVFSLNTSVNFAGGRYTLGNNGGIIIHSFHEFTEVGTANDNERYLNKQLMKAFGKVTSYQLKRNSLIFSGTEEAVKFARAN